MLQVLLPPAHGQERPQGLVRGRSLVLALGQRWVRVLRHWAQSLPLWCRLPVVVGRRANRLQA